ncbi:hypothetical protein O6H91_11G012300 [Diphasiastrum complanatum]|uniref:Uncharacterized protein n=4 Tax=Diphasiastrum complanatum TaxID=34168 RepID=A0ACC2C6E5_DIPCM|nr:hypothetical protein O6H91_11G012300 [Diphasiastrum complanatum]KAJ7537574.1 hypothetical protein O6H91_11G012300 [Diphasiastrum complanatum]KAJ7537575.1 hypothetical protein O6H91_11G012300 [Diphasiastrum complanatum]KAJ7537576.1 hypothetical protein O6H91_11G012300 [Diphasiastrum complanatum]
MVLARSKLQMKRKTMEEAAVDEEAAPGATPVKDSEGRQSGSGNAPSRRKRNRRGKKPLDATETHGSDEEREADARIVKKSKREMAVGIGEIESEVEQSEGEALIPKKRRKKESEQIVKIGKSEAQEVGGGQEAQKIAKDEAREIAEGQPVDRKEGDGVVYWKTRTKPRWPKIDGKAVRPESNVREGVKRESEGDHMLDEGDGTGHGNGNGSDFDVGGEGHSSSYENGVPTSEVKGDIQGLEAGKKKKKKKKKKPKKEKGIEPLDNGLVADITCEGTDGGFGLNEASGAGNEGAAQLESQEEQYELKKVMVGGMPYYSTEDDIHEYFSECGTIAELDCMTFPDTGRFRGIAFITFKTEAAAKKALALDGSDMGGRFLKIDLCKIKPQDRSKKETQPRAPPSKHEGCQSAYIGNLAWDITENDLRSFFKNCNIDSIRLAVNKETGEFRGFGHVDFADDESLEAAMKLDQHEVLGRPLKIAYAVPKRTQREGGVGVSENLSQAPKKARACYTCGEEGHISYQCPKKAVN